eukprot:TRINITY_DN9292_c0_g2_i1.p1 TRINITY_DN9292_c0_g2~~TRINITY_DN9292_c0_g2_i1.p1  ORF type:complete len:172 (-),score=10.93 TRINITY_DN9292_c0_g2_i1:307-822(-)
MILIVYVNFSLVFLGGGVGNVKVEFCFWTPLYYVLGVLIGGGLKGGQHPSPKKGCHFFPNKNFSNKIDFFISWCSNSRQTSFFWYFQMLLNIRISARSLAPKTKNTEESPPSFFLIRKAFFFKYLNVFFFAIVTLDIHSTCYFFMRQVKFYSVELNHCMNYYQKAVNFQHV